MSLIKHAVISAAGVGSRLGLNRAKCMVEVAGKTLLQHHMERLTHIENIWVVVGYQEDDVMLEAKRLRPDSIIVRNPDYLKTNTLQSIWLVARLLDEPLLIIDADTVIENKSFDDFMSLAKQNNALIGVSTFTTSDGVRVLTDEKKKLVTGFTRETDSSLEWTGIALITPEMAINQPIFVYESLASFLPLPLFEINAFDIDTIQDLDMAKSITTNGWKKP